MTKFFFIYFLGFLLISSVVASTCLDFCETTYELSLEIEEESEKIKDTEIEMVTDTVDYTIEKQFEVRSSIVYLSKKYTSVYLNLDSPPPRLS